MSRYVRMVLVGPLIFFAASVVGSVVAVRFVGTAVPVVAALVTGGIAIPALLLVARRRGRWPAMALRRPGAAGVGVAVVIGSAGLVVGVDALAGGTRVAGVDPATFVLFLVSTTLLALVHEALPEELAFRGLAYGELVRRVPAAVAATVATMLFALGVPLAIALGSALAGGPVRVAPEGQDPVEYVVLLVVFAVMLVLLRLVTGSLWAPIAAHVVFLLVNRTLLGTHDTGVDVVLPPGGEYLVPIYLLVAITALGVILARQRRPG